MNWKLLRSILDERIVMANAMYVKPYFHLSKEAFICWNENRLKAPKKYRSLPVILNNDPKACNHVKFFFPHNQI